MCAVGTCPRKSSGSAHHSVPLLGEQVGVKEREQGRVRDRDTEREREREDTRRKQGERQGAKPKEVRCFTPVAGADDGHVFKTQMCTMLRYWSHSLLVIRSGHPDH